MIRLQSDLPYLTATAGSTHVQLSAAVNNFVCSINQAVWREREEKVFFRNKVKQL